MAQGGKVVAVLVAVLSVILIAGGIVTVVVGLMAMAPADVTRSVMTVGLVGIAAGLAVAIVGLALRRR